ncbi:arylesterase monooxygenase [Fusarium albosuccineum]|uniref:Arylesterase monooxygenase n=1 Tax=Fusarium albosuccineum TaxID=1237068 RepID=A0A8H4L3P5_9HYPO|nr:arylesterase monooxygenase [Fusarium albosuccineum]
MSLDYDPDFLELIRPHFQSIQNSWTWEPLDFAAIRDGMPKLLASFLPHSPADESVETVQHSVKTFDGAKISVFRFFLKAMKQKTPTSAILHMHGGGMIMGSVVYQKDMLAEYVVNTGAQVFSVEYRLAPEHTGMSLVEDCYAALRWLYDNTAAFNVDSSRIAVMGDSAGGGLAAGVALLARDRGLSPPLAKQMLLAPMLDDRNVTGNKALEPFALWTVADNLTGWTAVLGEERGKDNVSGYIAAARSQDVEDLPRTYIDVGGLDIFRDEALSYSHRLAKSDIETEIHVYPGLPHCFELFGSQAPVVANVLQNRYRAIPKI